MILVNGSKDNENLERQNAASDAEETQRIINKLDNSVEKAHTVSDVELETERIINKLDNTYNVLMVIFVIIGMILGISLCIQISNASSSISIISGIVIFISYAVICFFTLLNLDYKTVKLQNISEIQKELKNLEK